jgi:plastocyanin
MTDTFDSRTLRVADCYAQRFMKAGTYRYHVLPAHSHWMTDERPFIIKVVERSAKTRMAQRSVVVTAKDRTFGVDPSEIAIEAGDLVLWHCPHARATPYVVVGDQQFFGSFRLVNESGYSHAFASAGEYRWVDAYGSGASGVVMVTDPGCADQRDLERWRRSLREGTLVTVDQATPHPRDVSIVTGQTVFFAITKGPGISITDARLVGDKA